MADGTKIEWTDATWNPITGCAVVSPGCTNCYAMKLAGTRLKNHTSRKGLTKDTKAGPVWTGEVRFNREWLDQPLRWTKPRMIFVCAHGDLFAEGVPDEWIDQVFAVMALSPQHTFQVLTKRPERMRDYLSSTDTYLRILGAADPLRAARPELGDVPISDTRHMSHWPHVWLGVSVEDQKRADERIPILLDTPAAVRWISAEPLLGPIDLKGLREFNPEGKPWVDALSGAVTSGGVPRSRRECGMNVRTSWELPKLDWVVAGGESGPGARPMHPNWARELRDQCAAVGVPFLFKQWGEWTPGENVERQRGVVDTAEFINDTWHYVRENLANTDGHIEDEPDLYRVGKKFAGRLLDGIEHNGFPEVRR
ncbi:phage Gp37/Gp68 family protein [Sinorhizobium sp. 8-89]|uniref:DUF5131 family protein n=1 Tax=Sinorhizobium sp. 7-81 TaxID=3049087 RepID=UPI0024C3FA3B|nr:phage Gp37/Gp68 family protein [Sinorhizobium sp. 7-81]MDK1386327.1 phage Gp37/Gp68 family protein [Sinorhizobium sp. 7-81]